MALNLDDPTEVALAAADAFAAAGLEAALYGGLALAVYGEPRETRDADLAVATVTVDAAHAALTAAGVGAVIAFRNMQFGGLVLARVSLLGGGKLNTVDLVTPRSPRFADAVLQRALRGSLDGHPLAVVSPEDFVLLKILSTRDHDLEDARTVVTSLGERLNRDLLISERALLANEIADHPIMDRFVAVLDDRTSPTK